VRRGAARVGIWRWKRTKLSAAKKQRYLGICSARLHCAVELDVSFLFLYLTVFDSIFALQSITLSLDSVPLVFVSYLAGINLFFSLSCCSGHGLVRRTLGRYSNRSLRAGMAGAFPL